MRTDTVRYLGDFEMTDDLTHVIDQSEPSIARVYDYLLGGKDNFEVDRAIGDHFKNNLPGSVAIATTNRQALIRAVRDIARDGIAQFIDLGSGLPTADNVHQVARRYAPATRVAYIDNDPIVLTHGRALLATDANTTVCQADLRDPKSIRERPEVLELIDFEQPVAIIFSATLHHLNDDENPADIVRYWSDQLTAGSRMYISHFRSGHNAETAAAEDKLQATFGRGRWRTDEEIQALFGDLELLPPGITPCTRWRPDPTQSTPPIHSTDHEPTVWEQLIVAGLARKR